MRFGGNNLIFSQMASAPNCSDLDNGRRAGNQADFRNFLKLAQMHNILMTTGGYPVEPVDIHPSVRHLECIRDLSILTDKAFHIYSLGKERNVDGIEIARIARGISREQLQDEPSVYTIINTNSPLKLDVPMMEGIIQMSGNGQLVIVTPFTLAGAMAPVTASVCRELFQRQGREAGARKRGAGGGGGHRRASVAGRDCGVRGPLERQAESSCSQARQGKAPTLSSATILAFSASSTSPSAAAVNAARIDSSRR